LLGQECAPTPDSRYPECRPPCSIRGRCS
jgi:hypothetical protein